MTNQSNTIATATPAISTAASPKTAAPMTAGPIGTTASEHGANAKKLLLQDIRVKWGKFSEQELGALQSNEDLVDQLVAKYGLAKEAAKRDADAMLKGRNL
jgi:hypothetical protein